MIKISTRQFFSHYMFHPVAKNLNSCNKAWALINSIALGIFTLGICHLICALIYRNRTFHPEPLKKQTNQAPLIRVADERFNRRPVRAAEVAPVRAIVEEPARPVEAAPVRAIVKKPKVAAVRAIQTITPFLTPPPDLNPQIKALGQITFGAPPLNERPYEQDLKDYYTSFAEVHFSEIGKKREEAIRHQIKQSKVAIVGAGPAGLIAAYEAYLHGEKVTLIEKRNHYARDQILRLSEDTFDYLRRILGRALDTFLSSQEIVQHKTGFSTIEVKDLETVLSIMLRTLSLRDPENFSFHSNCAFMHLLNPSRENPTWRISIRNQTTGLEELVETDLLVGADGGKSKVREAGNFDFNTCSSAFTYGAVTFDQPEGIRSIDSELDIDIPQVVYNGAALSTRPDKEIVLAQIKHERKRTGIAAQVERLSKIDAPRYQRYIQDSKNLEDADLDFVRLGVDEHLKFLKEQFGWKLDRLPISRFFTSAETVYLGCEFPDELFQQLHQMDADSVREHQIRWYKALLKAHLPDYLIEKLKPRHGSVFPLELGKMPSPYKLNQSLNQKLHLFCIGDAFLTPHFLTGSGAQHAIHMSKRFGELLVNINQDRNPTPALKKFKQEMVLSADAVHLNAFTEGMLIPK